MTSLDDPCHGLGLQPPSTTVLRPAPKLFSTASHPFTSAADSGWECPLPSIETRRGGDAPFNRTRNVLMLLACGCDSKQPDLAALHHENLRLPPSGASRRVLDVAPQ